MKDKILYAEDKETLREYIRIVLETYFPELEKESFQDGNSLEERLKGNLEDVRLVITDNGMPGKNGSEIIKTYAKRPEFKDVRFILYYGGEPFTGEQAVKNYGAYASVLKGTKPEELIGKIREALNYSKPITSSQ